MVNNNWNPVGATSPQYKKFLLQKAKKLAGMWQTWMWHQLWTATQTACITWWITSNKIIVIISTLRLVYPVPCVLRFSCVLVQQVALHILVATLQQHSSYIAKTAGYAVHMSCGWVKSAVDRVEALPWCCAADGHRTGFVSVQGPFEFLAVYCDMTSTSCICVQTTGVESMHDRRENLTEAKIY